MKQQKAKMNDKIVKMLPLEFVNRDNLTKMVSTLHHIELGEPLSVTYYTAEQIDEVLNEYETYIRDLEQRLDINQKK